MDITSTKETEMATMTKKHEAPVSWKALLEEAINKPGHLASCYRLFHNYSFGNQGLAMWQMMARKIEVGPIATFNKWKQLGRMIKKGSKALILCVPITVRREEQLEDGTTEVRYITIGFDYKAKWFALSQTDGKDVEPEPVPGWDLERAMRTLRIERTNFNHVNGNYQGYAHKRQIALNPVAAHPLRTMVHEMAHVVLGHTDDMTTVDENRVPYNVGELEAEAVAYIVCETFGLGGASESRGYIQHWYKDNKVSDETAERIFGAANRILSAGKEEK